MADTEFYIQGKNIFDVGFRPGLIQLADELGVKVHATNLRKDKKIRVIASGSHESVTAYCSSIQKRDVPTILGAKEHPIYSLTGKKEYNGPDIDWDSYNLQFMSAQLSKAMLYSNDIFKNINDKLDLVIDNTPSRHNRTTNKRNGRKTKMKAARKR
jgi:acylphosphatase